MTYLCISLFLPYIQLIHVCIYYLNFFTLIFTYYSIVIVQTSVNNNQHNYDVSWHPQSFLQKLISYFYILPFYILNIWPMRSLYFDVKLDREERRRKNSSLFLAVKFPSKQFKILIFPDHSLHYFSAAFCLQVFLCSLYEVLQLQVITKLKHREKKIPRFEN